MILLLGGTSETAEIATKLAEAGHQLLVSTATDAPLEVGEHPNISHRYGRLDADEMARLVLDRKIRVIVDATHPYASVVRATARSVADRIGIKYLTFIRPTALVETEGIIVAEDHDQAAKAAFLFGRAVLLTTGSRNLVPYVRESRKTGLRLIARVLDHPESLEACRDAGLDPASVITGRGPFSLEDNIADIRRHGIGVLVTKDSGTSGGMEAKQQAAELENCKLVVVQRPESIPDNVFNSIFELVDGCIQLLPPNITKAS